MGKSGIRSHFIPDFYFINNLWRSSIVHVEEIKRHKKTREIPGFFTVVKVSSYSESYSSRLTTSSSAIRTKNLLRLGMMIMLVLLFLALFLYVELSVIGT